VIRSSSSLRKFLVTPLVLFGTLGCLTLDAEAYSPESPKVQAMVRKATQYIERNYAKDSGSYYERLGGTCLVGMTIYKVAANPEHPRFKPPLKSARLPVGRVYLGTNIATTASELLLSSWLKLTRNSIDLKSRSSSALC
jgi:hypothetical protein